MYRDINDLTVMIGADIYSPEQAAAELRRIRRMVANLTTRQTGTAAS